MKSTCHLSPLIALLLAATTIAAEPEGKPNFLIILALVFMMSQVQWDF